MGDVYLATAQGAAGFEKQVVLKLLRPSGKHGFDVLREAFIGVSLDHANIVQVFDVGEHEGRFFIVMEYVRGFTLGHVFDDAQRQGTALPLPLVAHVVSQIAEALEHVHVHGEGFLHRDVSPSNILLGVDGRVKLSDFGVAALATETRRDSLVGKPAYLPPECFGGAAATQAWDVYALGVVLWEALAGKRPFVDDSFDALKAKIYAGPPPLAEIGAARGYPPAIVEVAERAIHAEPAHRYGSASELLHALATAVPPGTFDTQLYRRYMKSCYTSPSFVARYGEVANRERTPTPIRVADAPTVDISMQPIRIGLSQAGGSGWARGEGERLAARLGKAVGRGAVEVVVADYRSLVDTLCTGALDVAWMPPAAYVEAQRRGARVLAVSSRMGKPSYHAAIIARADAQIGGLDELRGRSIAWVDRDSASGYLFAMAEIQRTIGVAALGRQHFVGSHRAVCEAVADGWATAGSTYAVLDDGGKIVTGGWQERLGPRAEEIKVVALTRPIPGDNLACRPGIDGELRAGLSRALIALSGDDEGRAILRDVFRAEGLVGDPGDIYGDVRETLELVRLIP
jgi:phosphate/phosphite/phosphonate ABC transporter binding protein